jgi:hypothetical protein
MAVKKFYNIGLGWQHGSNFYLVKNHKIGNNPATAAARGRNKQILWNPWTFRKNNVYLSNFKTF